MEGYIKIFRSIKNWEWFTDANTLKLWIYILVRANWEESNFRGIVIHEGQMIESLQSIATNTGMSIQSVRTCLNHLKSTREITCQSTRQGIVINVNKWAFYQGQGFDANTKTNTISNTKLTRNQQHSKNNKKNKKTNNSSTTPTLPEISSYISENNLSVNASKFFSYYESKQWNGVTDWKKALHYWHNTERKTIRSDRMPEYLDDSDALSDDVLNKLKKELKEYSNGRNDEDNS